MQRSLTAAERETTINMDDESEMATVTTWQRSVITRLRKNPAAVQVREMHHGTSVGAVFCIPRRLISFRSVVRTGRGNPEALEKARQVKRGAAA